MSSLVRVPHSAVSILTKVGRLTAPRSRALLAVLTDGDAPLSTVTLVQRLSKAMQPTLTEAECREFVDQVFSIAALEGSHNYPASLIAQEVANSTGLDLTERQRKTLRQILEEALISPIVGALGKATDIATEYRNLFHVARIFTDIRPVFEDVDDSPLGAVITHSLRMSFVHDGRLEALDIALTGVDIDSLRETLDRADRKAVSLNRMLQAASLPVFDLLDGAKDEK